MRRLLVTITAFLVLAGAFAWWWSRPERVVSRRVAGLFDSAEVGADAGNVTRSTRGTAIEGYLAPRITFEGPEGPTEEVEGSRRREDIVTMYGALARFSHEISLRDLDIQSVTVSGDQADVTATLDAVIALPNEERPVDGIQNLSLSWRKIDGKWLLERAKWSESGRGARK